MTLLHGVLPEHGELVGGQAGRSWPGGSVFPEQNPRSSVRTAETEAG